MSSYPKEWPGLRSTRYSTTNQLYEIVEPKDTRYYSALVADADACSFFVRDIETGLIFLSDKDNFIPLTDAAKALYPDPKLLGQKWRR